MTNNKTENAGRSCAFVLQIREPEETLKKLSMFFLERRIPIDSLQMIRLRSGEARLIIYCQIEKDRISRTAKLLEQMKGIMELEKLEER